MKRQFIENLMQSGEGPVAVDDLPFQLYDLPGQEKSGCGRLIQKRADHSERKAGVAVFPDQQKAFFILLRKFIIAAPCFHIRMDQAFFDVKVNISFGDSCLFADFPEASSRFLLCAAL